MPIPIIRQQTDFQLTPQGSSDKVTSLEVRTIVHLILNDLRDMGVLQVATPEGLATVGTNDGRFAYVENVGFFKYLPEGLPNNSTSFPSSDSGIWEQRMTGASGGGDVPVGGDFVPTTRMVNGKALDQDIEIALSDIPGAENIDNTPDDAKPVSVPQQEAFDALQAQIDALAAVNATQQAAIIALQGDLPAKADLVGGKVPSGELPSYVDTIAEYATAGDFPATGSASVIYVDLSDSNQQYRWSGSVYVPLGGAGGGGNILDAYFTTTDNQTVVPLPASIGKYVFSVRVGSDSGWKVLHGGTGTLAEYEVRHNATAGTLTFGSALPASDNNLALFF